MASVPQQPSRGVRPVDVANLPYIVSVNGDPLFAGQAPTGTDLYCANGCDQILIKDYHPDDFVKVGMQCFKCAHVTRTPSLIDGEVLSARPLRLQETDATGPYYLNQTVRNPGIIITTDAEVERVLKLTAPRESAPTLDLSRHGLRALIDRFNAIAGADQFELHAKILTRRAATPVELPFAWSIIHLQSCVDDGRLDLARSDTNTAVTWLSTFCHVVEAWGHHPRFLKVAKTLSEPKAFIHTCGLFITAGQLYAQGHQIGLSLEDLEGESNPDLYIRVSSREKIHFEIKAPESLQAQAQRIPDEVIETSVKKHLKKSSRQIHTGRPGVLVLVATASELSEKIERAAELQLKLSGRNHKSLAGITGVTKIGDVSGQFGFNFTTAPNPHYVEPAPAHV
jgi:hypothetical protein